ncbi:16S rRNA (cytidine(1402)-2'-O)-methyltransferase [Bombilactobacillus thymidiniphilus]|uniref:Ribosomal RNA small subunit methyltransferase I n=1 Tax=Bombilactobacillus thymidiniphilus TaxID=2923363 RepID=A0ABY4PDS0_9LACO|nr:16S rRNA (cytidine(1402)-2'-O)-methyltransferase [Bombilactobacillus thymidiniphilus]UQS83928.1 16S rRNA (cytidine(1402)-2'-O)-methyltransferase [Bombilactobacillus thymidiniphilus]
MIAEMSSFQQSNSGSLFLVPTPIGNLQDMSPRAVATLNEVDLIAAEDTRNTQKLLNHFQIKTKQLSFHEHNTQQRLPELLQKLQAGLNIAQVSDAGMPSISDPGQELVALCIEKQIPVIPLPGPNAALTALIASGLLPQPFYFYGFLPRKSSAVRQELAKLAELTATFILYESPYRIKKTLQALQNAVGDQRQVVLARELTKVHEAFLRGSVAQVQEYFSQHEPRGEYVIIVQAKPAALVNMTITDEKLVDLVTKQIKQGQKPNAAIKEIAQQYQLPRKHVYDVYHGLEK